MCGVTREDIVKSEFIRVSVGVYTNCRKNEGKKVVVVWSYYEKSLWLGCIESDYGNKFKRKEKESKTKEEIRKSWK